MFEILKDAQRKDSLMLPVFNFNFFLTLILLGANQTLSDQNHLIYMDYMLLLVFFVVDDDDAIKYVTQYLLLILIDINLPFSNFVFTNKKQ